MSDFSNKTIVITGASRGIGEAAARHFGTLGANVVLAARSREAIDGIADDITSSGGKARAVACDVADPDAVAQLIETTNATFGRIDILVNNAGLLDPIARLTDFDPADWDKVIDVNVKGVFYAMHAAIPKMVAQGGGTIINISSGAAYGALEGWSHYCASKAAVLSLTKSGHKEYGDQGVRVIGLSPGTVATHMQVQIKDSGINPVSQLDPAIHIPPAWVAQAIAYLSGTGGEAYLGTDFMLRDDSARDALGLPRNG